MIHSKYIKWLVLFLAYVSSLHLMACSCNSQTPINKTNTSSGKHSTVVPNVLITNKTQPHKTKKSKQPTLEKPYPSSNPTHRPNNVPTHSFLADVNQLSGKKRILLSIDASPSTWQPYNDGSFDAEYPEANHAFFNAHNNTLYAASYEHGVLISKNHGKSFTRHKKNMASPTVHWLDVDKNGVIYAATQNGISISRNQGRSFTNHNSQFDDPKIVWLDIHDNGNLYALNDSGDLIVGKEGERFTYHKSSDYSDIDSPFQFIHVADDGTLWAELDNGGLALSLDDGQTFSKLSFENSSIDFMKIDQNGRIIVITNRSAVLISEDKGQNFHIDTVISDQYADISLIDMLIDSQNTFYFFTDQGLLVSRDNGQSYQNISDFSSEPIGSFYLDHKDTLYLQTEDGIYLSNNQGRSFTNICPDMQDFEQAIDLGEGIIIAGIFPNLTWIHMDSNNQVLALLDTRFAKSSNKGQTWSKKQTYSYYRLALKAALNTIDLMDEDAQIAFITTHDNFIFSGLLPLWSSLDQAKTLIKKMMALETTNFDDLRVFALSNPNQQEGMASILSWMASEVFEYEQPDLMLWMHDGILDETMQEEITASQAERPFPIHFKPFGDKDDELHKRYFTEVPQTELYQDIVLPYGF